MRDLFLLGLAACGPRWVDPREQPFALREAVEAAASDYRCEEPVPRCDASHGATWEFELDVCGMIRRYTVTDKSYGEVPLACDAAICLTPQPPCRSVMQGGWWAVEAHAPERCDDAPVDEGITVGFRDGLVSVEAQGRRIVNASCTDPSFLVFLDGRWFALCGARPVATVDGFSAEPGLMAADGDHDVYAVYVGLDGCVRSREQTVHTVRPPSWKDIVIIE